MRILLLAISISLFACSSQAQKNEPKKDVQKQAKVIEDINLPFYDALQDSLDTLVILDVRTPAEWEEGIIEGAVMIDYFSDDFDAGLAKLNPDLPVVVYCRSGGRSSKTALKLKNLGFQKVYNLREGASAWY